jgi:membrane-bound lytic murein transglycosylase D
MTVKSRFLLTASAVLMTGALAGCTAARKQPFQMSFLPPATARAISRGQITEAPPEIAASAYFHRETPRILNLSLETPPRSAQIEARLRRAEELFQAGKRLLSQGEIDAARQEFDRAIDLLLDTSEAAPDRQQAERKLEELAERIHRLDLEALGAAEPDPLLTFEKAPIDDLTGLTFPIDPRQKTKVRQELEATVSQLPLEVNDAVLGYINYFSNGRGQRTVVAGLRRAGRYSALISRILDEEGVPQELIHLAQAESGFMPRAVSRKAATGMWQFVRDRGREYGLGQSPYHDDRLDPEKATRAAARHLRDLYQQFGDWYLAMAAYNCGPMNVERAIQRTGYADFWELRNRNVLPRETANYVPAILAMVIVVKNAKDYGLEAVEPDPPLEYDTIEMTAPTHLALVADATDQPLATIREMNPSLLKSLAPAGYQLHVPKGSSSFAAAALGLVPEAHRNAWRIHRAASGDSLASIAKRYGTTVSSIQSANRFLDAEPGAGEMVVVPAPLRAETRSVARKASRSSGSKSASRSTSRRPASRLAARKKPASAVHVAQAGSKRAAAAR